MRKLALVIGRQLKLGSGRSDSSIGQKQGQGINVTRPAVTAELVTPHVALNLAPRAIEAINRVAANVPRGHAFTDAAAAALAVRGQR